MQRRGKKLSPVRHVTLGQLTDQERANIDMVLNRRPQAIATVSGNVQAAPRGSRTTAKHEDGDEHRRRAAQRHHAARAARATVSYKKYLDHPVAKRVMTFAEWRKPGLRKRRLAEYRDVA